MKNLLVTGATGLLGTEVCRLAGQRLPGWTIHALCNAHGIPTEFSSKLVLHHLDLTDAESLKALFSSQPFDAVVHLAAMTDPNGCQLHPNGSRRINLLAPVEIAAWCAPTKTHFLLASTDLVFDGTNPPYSESSAPNPLSLYAQQKREAEAKLLGMLGNDLSICRLPLLFGGPSFSGRNPLEGLVRSFETQAPTKLFVDEFRTPVSVATAAEGLLVALQHRPALVHLGGRERVSRLDFGKRLAVWLGKPYGNLIPALQKDVAMSAPRPADVSLDSRLAYRLGYAPSTLEEEFGKVEFLRLSRDRSLGLRAGFAGGGEDDVGSEATA